MSLDVEIKVLVFQWVMMENAPKVLTAQLINIVTWVPVQILKKLGRHAFIEMNAVDKPLASLITRDLFQANAPNT